YSIGVEFISSGEYRTLQAAYREIQDVRFPVVVRATSAADSDKEDTARDNAADEALAEEAGIATADDTAIGGAPLDDPTRLAADPKDRVAAAAGVPGRVRKEPDVTLENVDAFVDFFITAGKKGIAINRYKGLGEMNPDTLWTTTMDPDNRTLLQVRAEDHTEADQMFTTLMGD